MLDGVAARARRRRASRSDRGWTRPRSPRPRRSGAARKCGTAVWARAPATPARAARTRIGIPSRRSATCPRGADRRARRRSAPASAPGPPAPLPGGRGEPPRSRQPGSRASRRPRSASRHVASRTGRPKSRPLSGSSRSTCAGASGSGDVAATIQTCPARTTADSGKRRAPAPLARSGRRRPGRSRRRAATAPRAARRRAPS